MLHILLGVVAISLKGPVLVKLIPVGGITVDGRSMMLQANITLFGCPLVLFSLLSSVVFESELEVSQSRLLFSVLLGNMVFASRATSALLACGF